MIISDSYNHIQLQQHSCNATISLDVYHLFQWRVSGYKTEIEVVATRSSVTVWLEKRKKWFSYVILENKNRKSMITWRISGSNDTSKHTSKCFNLCCIWHSTAMVSSSDRTRGGVPICRHQQSLTRTLFITVHDRRSVTPKKNTLLFFSSLLLTRSCLSSMKLGFRIRVAIASRSRHVLHQLPNSCQQRTHDSFLHAHISTAPSANPQKQVTLFLLRSVQLLHTSNLATIVSFFGFTCSQQ